jgi:S1-C subfamily serine protease
MRALMGYGLLVRSSEEGPFVSRVVDDSPAAEAGFKRGQIILKVGESDVKGPSAVYLAAAEQGLLVGKRLQFTIADVGSDQAGAPRAIDVQVLR